MSKVILGKRPKNFKRNVSFVMLDGEVATIECLFKYRTRTEFGAFLDSIFEDAKEDKAENVGVGDLMAKTSAKNADYLLKVLDGWNLDEEINRQNLEQLADECPAAVTAIMEAYRSAILDGRLGN